MSYLESVMLADLAFADGISASDVLRLLLRREHAERSKDPRFECSEPFTKKERAAQAAFRAQELAKKEARAIARAEKARTTTTKAKAKPKPATKPATPKRSAHRA